MVYNVCGIFSMISIIVRNLGLSMYHAIMYLISFGTHGRYIANGKVSLTFRLRTPHLLKSDTWRLYVSLVMSVASGRIWHTGSVIGSIPRSSANSGCPLKPSGFRSRADIESLIPMRAFPERADSLLNVHWMSDTETEKESELAFVSTRNVWTI